MRSDEVIEQAQTAAGVDHIGDATFRAGLDLLVDQANACTSMTREGAERFKALLVGYLTNRLRVDDYVREHPQVLEAPVEAPIVVLGVPRTGTTLTSSLLGADPNLRPLLNWEAVDSIPPPTTETLRSDPRCVAKKQERARLLAEDPERGKYRWEEADGPTECVFVHAQDCRSAMLEASFPMPEYTKWLLECDMRPTYAYEKRVLQVLQSQAPGTWSLKAPSHALFIDALLATFPDAVLVWTHRDPLTAVGSLCSLIRRNQSQYVDAVDERYLGQNYLRHAVEHVRRPMAVKDRLGEDRIYDLYYSELMRDPIAEMRKLYSWMGRTLSEAAESAMRAWLEANPQGKYGRHTYTLEEFGLTEQQVRSALAEYLERFPVPREG